MNVVRIMGGLGNQLFQYAFGRVLETHAKTPSAYNLDWYKKNRTPPRPYVLDKFGMTVHPSLFLQTRKYTETMDGSLPPLDVHNYHFNGYWQNPALYSIELREEFREAFHIRPEFYTVDFLDTLAEIKDCNAVALHVRRGDYLDNPNHLVLPLQYYQNALMYMDRMRKDIEVFVFSDDIPWCREYFAGDGFHFVEMDDYLEFELMRACKHFIIANSTFSWWAAYLSYNAMIIAPRQWMLSRVNGAAVYEKRILSLDWMKIYPS